MKNDSSLIISFRALRALFSGKIRKVPNHFSYQVALVVNIVEPLEVLRHVLYLEIFSPYPRRILKCDESVSLVNSELNKLFTPGESPQWCRLHIRSS